MPVSINHAERAGPEGANRVSGRGEAHHLSLSLLGGADAATSSAFRELGRDTGGGTDEITYLFSYLDLNGDGIEKRELDFLQMPKRSVQHFKLFLKNAGQVRNVPGSVAAGWRMHFDPHNVGNVSAIAFQAHCQSLGFSA